MANELSSLSPAKGSKKSKTRLGRGEGSGKGRTAGRGMKGQYQFHRGIGVDAIVNEGYKIVKKDSTNNVSVPQDENKWNPADIWMVRNDFDYDTFRLSYAKGRVLNFNSELLKQYNEENMLHSDIKFNKKNTKPKIL